MLRCRDVCIRSAGARAGSYISRGFGGRTIGLGYASGGLLKAASLSSQASSWASSQKFQDPLERPTRPRDVIRRIRGQTNTLPEQKRLILKEFLPENDQQGGTANKEEAESLLALASGKKTRQRMPLNKIEKEMQWLQDPRALADRVARLLKGRDPVMAAGLVRRAHKQEMPCVVAWGHLMQYCMDRGVPQAAFKFYNDMKKRGGRPSAATFTIMLNGFAKNSHLPGVRAVQHAYSIFKSISHEKSLGRPNIIHLNAMLKVCAWSHDMDTLWKVLDELPEDAPKPDMKTYTVILKAIKDTTQRDIDRIPENQVDEIIARRAVGVRDGKRLWADIVSQWRTGQLVIDYSLVCVMAELLLDHAGERGCYDALALFNQTTGVPIFAKPPPGDIPSDPSARRRRYEDTVRDPLAPAVRSPERRDILDQDALNLEDQQMARIDPAEAEEEETQENFEGLFDPVTSTTSNGNTLTLLTPGTRDLSLILEACRLMNQGAGAGKEYWEYLTLKDSGHKVQPDEDNFHQYLRLLRVARSSRISLEVIRDQMMPADAVRMKTFQIAMSCCRRDRANPNVLNIANELLALMDAHLPLPDPKALLGYLDLVDVLAENPQWLLTLNGLDVDEKDRSNLRLMGRKLKLALLRVALSAMRPHVSKLCDTVEQGAATKFGGGTRRRLHERMDNQITGFLVLKVLVRTRALMDDVLGSRYESLLSKSDREWLEPEAKSLRKFSNPYVVVKLEKAVLIPTPEQIDRYLEIRQQFLGPEQPSSVSNSEMATEDPSEATKQAKVEPKEGTVDPAEKQVEGREHLETEREIGRMNEPTTQ